MIETIYDLLNEETRTDTVIVRGLGFITKVVLLLAALKYLL